MESLEQNQSVAISVRYMYKIKELCSTATTDSPLRHTLCNNGRSFPQQTSPFPHTNPVPQTKRPLLNQRWSLFITLGPLLNQRGHCSITDGHCSFPWVHCSISEAIAITDGHSKKHFNKLEKTTFYFSLKHQKIIFLIFLTIQTSPRPVKNPHFDLCLRAFT